MDKPQRNKLEKQIALIWHKAGVTEPELDECAEWCFGKGAWYVPVSPEWIKRWNKYHGRIFEAKKSDKFVEFIFVTGFFYMQEKEQRKRIIFPN